MTDDPIPRYLVLRHEPGIREFQSEAEALAYGELMAARMSDGRRQNMVVEVVRSVRRWELDAPTGELLEVGERLVQ